MVIIPFFGGGCCLGHTQLCFGFILGRDQTSFSCVLVPMYTTSLPHLWFFFSKPNSSLSMCLNDPVSLLIHDFFLLLQSGESLGYCCQEKHQKGVNSIHLACASWLGSHSWFCIIVHFEWNPKYGMEFSGVECSQV